VVIGFRANYACSDISATGVEVGPNGVLELTAGDTVFLGDGVAISGELSVRIEAP